MRPAGLPAGSTKLRVFTRQLWLSSGCSPGNLLETYDGPHDLLNSRDMISGGSWQWHPIAMFFSIPNMDNDRNIDLGADPCGLTVVDLGSNCS